MAQKKRPTPAPTRGSNRWIFPAVLIGIVVVGILAVVLVAAGGDDDGGSDSGGGASDKVEIASQVTVDGTALPAYDADARDGALGMTAPNVSSVDFDGNPVEIGGATGSPYAVVFLAHWCPHCQAEVPRLVSLAQDGQIEGVDVHGVLTGTSDRQDNYPPSAWLASEDWPFGVAVDDAEQTAARAYGLTSYPFMVFVDADGQVVGRVSGEVAEDDLEAIFAALAAGETLPLTAGGGSSSS